MPPKQCPECARFLRNAFVVRLQDAPAPCPGCGVELSPASIDGDGPDGGSSEAPSDLPGELLDGALDGATAGPADDAPDDRSGGGPSVRPPDLPPATVRDASDDVLAGWDIGVDPVEVAAWRRDERPFPLDSVLVGGGGALGSVIGVLAWPGHRVAGAGIGATLGMVTVAVVRRIWRLEG